MENDLKNGEFRFESYRRFDSSTGERELDCYFWQNHKKSDKAGFIDAVVDKIYEVDQVRLYWGLKGDKQTSPRIYANKRCIEIFGDPVFNKSQLGIHQKSHFDAVAKSIVEKLGEGKK
jgi:hypothetical protein